MVQVKISNQMDFKIRFQMNFYEYLTLVVSEDIPFSNKAHLILLMSPFFRKKSSFFGKNSTFTQSSSVRAVKDFLLLFSIFER